MLYFDNSATSPVDPEVVDAMLPYLKEEFGNPSSKYYYQAVQAQQAIDEARENVAKLFGTKFENVVFTAGATESTNFILKGYMDYRRYYGDGRNHIITSIAEHKATLNTCKYLNGEIYSNDDPTISLLGEKKRVNRGYEASFVGVTKSGEIMADTIAAAIKANTALVSVIYVNNEVGTISDIQKISKVCHEKGIIFHTDVTQALGKIPINAEKMGIDYASCSAHKIYGPKGIGAALLKSDAYGIEPITAFMHGGEQEFGVRGGTLAVHDIVGFGKAAELAYNHLDENISKLKMLDQIAVSELTAIPYVRLTNPEKNRMPGIISIIVDRQNFHNERFIKQVSDELAISTGSACSAGEPSHVIDAMGLGNDVTKVLRISIGKNSSKEDVLNLVEIIKRNL